MSGLPHDIRFGSRGQCRHRDNSPSADRFIFSKGKKSSLSIPYKRHSFDISSNFLDGENEKTKEERGDLRFVLCKDNLPSMFQHNQNLFDSSKSKKLEKSKISQLDCSSLTDKNSRVMSNNRYPSRDGENGDPYRDSCDDLRDALLEKGYNNVVVSSESDSSIDSESVSSLNSNTDLSQKNEDSLIRRKEKLLSRLIHMTDSDSDTESVSSSQFSPYSTTGEGSKVRKQFTFIKSSTPIVPVTNSCTAPQTSSRKKYCGTKQFDHFHAVSPLTHGDVDLDLNDHGEDHSSLSDVHQDDVTVIDGYRRYRKAKRYSIHSYDYTSDDEEDREVTHGGNQIQHSIEHGSMEFTETSTLKRSSGSSSLSKDMKENSSERIGRKRYRSSNQAVTSGPVKRFQGNDDKSYFSNCGGSNHRTSTDGSALRKESHTSSQDLYVDRKDKVFNSSKSHCIDDRSDSENHFRRSRSFTRSSSRDSYDSRSNDVSYSSRRGSRRSSRSISKDSYDYRNPSPDRDSIYYRQRERHRAKSRNRDQSDSRYSSRRSISTERCRSRRGSPEDNSERRNERYRHYSDSPCSDYSVESSASNRHGRHRHYSESLNIKDLGKQCRSRSRVGHESESSQGSRNFKAKNYKRQKKKGEIYEYNHDHKLLIHYNSKGSISATTSADSDNSRKSISSDIHRNKTKSYHRDINKQCSPDSDDTQRKERAQNSSKDRNYSSTSEVEWSRSVYIPSDSSGKDTKKTKKVVVRCNVSRDRKEGSVQSSCSSVRSFKTNQSKGRTKTVDKKKISKKSKSLRSKHKSNTENAGKTFGKMYKKWKHRHELKDLLQLSYEEDNLVSRTCTSEYESPRSTYLQQLLRRRHEMKVRELSRKAEGELTGAFSGIGSRKRHRSEAVGTSDMVSLPTRRARCDSGDSSRSSSLSSTASSRSTSRDKNVRDSGVKTKQKKGKTSKCSKYRKDKARIDVGTVSVKSITKTATTKVKGTTSDQKPVTPAKKKHLGALDASEKIETVISLPSSEFWTVTSDLEIVDNMEEKSAGGVTTQNLISLRNPTSDSESNKELDDYDMVLMEKIRQYHDNFAQIQNAGKTESMSRLETEKPEDPSTKAIKQEKLDDILEQNVNNANIPKPKYHSVKYGEEDVIVIDSSDDTDGDDSHEDDDNVTVTENIVKTPADAIGKTVDNRAKVSGSKVNVQSLDTIDLGGKDGTREQTEEYIKKNAEKVTSQNFKDAEFDSERKTNSADILTDLKNKNSMKEDISKLKGDKCNRTKLESKDIITVIREKCVNEDRILTEHGHSESIDCEPEENAKESDEKYNLVSVEGVSGVNEIIVDDGDTNRVADPDEYIEFSGKRGFKDSKIQEGELTGSKQLKIIVDVQSESQKVMHQNLDQVQTRSEVRSLEEIGYDCTRGTETESSFNDSLSSLEKMTGNPESRTAAENLSSYVKTFKQLSEDKMDESSIDIEKTADKAFGAVSTTSHCYPQEITPLVEENSNKHVELMYVSPDTSACDAICIEDKQKEKGKGEDGTYTDTESGSQNSLLKLKTYYSESMQISTDNQESCKFDEETVNDKSASHNEIKEDNNVPSMSDEEGIDILSVGNNKDNHLLKENHCENPSLTESCYRSENSTVKDQAACIIDTACSPTTAACAGKNNIYSFLAHSDKQVYGENVKGSTSENIGITKAESDSDFNEGDHSDEGTLSYNDRHNTVGENMQRKHSSVLSEGDDNLNDSTISSLAEHGKSDNQPGLIIDNKGLNRRANMVCTESVENTSSSDADKLVFAHTLLVQMNEERVCDFVKCRKNNKADTENDKSDLQKIMEKKSQQKDHVINTNEIIYTDAIEDKDCCSIDISENENHDVMEVTATVTCLSDKTDDVCLNSVEVREMSVAENSKQQLGEDCKMTIDKDKEISVVALVQCMDESMEEATGSKTAQFIDDTSFHLCVADNEQNTGKQESRPNMVPSLCGYSSSESESEEADTTEGDLSVDTGNLLGLPTEGDHTKCIPTINQYGMNHSSPADTAGDWTTSVSGNDQTNVSGNGPTSVSGNGPTSVSGNGPTSVSGNGPTSVSGNGPTNVSGNGPTSVSGNDQTNVSGNGPTSVSGNGPTSVSGNGPTNVSGNGPASVSGNGPTSVSGNGPASVSGNGPTNVSGNGPASVSGNGPTSVSGNDQTNVSGSGPTSVSGNGPTSVSGNGPTSVSGNDQTNVSGNGPTSVSGNGPTSVSGNGPTSVSGNGPTSVSGNDQTNVSGNGPASVSGNGPTSVSGNGPTSVSGNGPTSVSGNVNAIEGHNHLIQPEPKSNKLETCTCNQQILDSQHHERRQTYEKESYSKAESSGHSFETNSNLRIENDHDDNPNDMMERAIAEFYSEIGELLKENSEQSDLACHNDETSSEQKECKIASLLSEQIELMNEGAEMMNERKKEISQTFIIMNEQALTFQQNEQSKENYHSHSMKQAELECVNSHQSFEQNVQTHENVQISCEQNEQEGKKLSIKHNDQTQGNTQPFIERNHKDTIVCTEQFEQSHLNTLPLYNENEQAHQNTPTLCTHNEQVHLDTQPLCKQNEQAHHDTQPFCKQNEQAHHDTQPFCKQIEQAHHITQPFCKQNEQAHENIPQSYEQSSCMHKNAEHLFVQNNQAHEKIQISVGKNENKFENNQQICEWNEVTEKEENHQATFNNKSDECGKLDEEMEQFYADTVTLDKCSSDEFSKGINKNPEILKEEDCQSSALVTQCADLNKSLSSTKPKHHDTVLQLQDSNTLICPSANEVKLVSSTDHTVQNEEIEDSVVCQYENLSIAIHSNNGDGNIHHRPLEKNLRDMPHTTDKLKRCDHSYAMTQNSVSNSEVISSDRILKSPTDQGAGSSPDTVDPSTSSNGDIPLHIQRVLIERLDAAEQQFRHDHFLMVSTTNFLISKDPSIKDSLESCLKQCLDELCTATINSVQEFTNHILAENNIHLDRQQ